jgi:hypothetical protein
MARYLVAEQGFDRELDELAKILREGPWFKLKRDEDAQGHEKTMLGAQIGYLQDLKKVNPACRRRLPVKGEWHYLLESTHETLQLAVRRFPEIGDACRAAIGLLGQIEAVKRNHYDKRAFDRRGYLRKIYSLLGRDLYLVLLYFTYLRIELGDEHAEIKGGLRLLRAYRFFSELGTYGSGLNNCFFEFHGSELFCDPGVNFKQRYYQDHSVGPGDTLRGVILENYTGPNVHFQDYLDAILTTDRIPPGFDVATDLDKPLSEFGVKSVAIVPPQSGRSAYEERMKRFVEWLETSDGNLWQGDLRKPGATG